MEEAPIVCGRFETGKSIMHPREKEGERNSSVHQLRESYFFFCSYPHRANLPQRKWSTTSCIFGWVIMSNSQTVACTSSNVPSKKKKNTICDTFLRCQWCISTLNWIHSRPWAARVRSARATSSYPSNSDSTWSVRAQSSGTVSLLLLDSCDNK